MVATRKLRLEKGRSKSDAKVIAKLILCPLQNAGEVGGLEQKGPLGDCGQENKALATNSTFPVYWQSDPLFIVYYTSHPTNAGQEYPAILSSYKKRTI